MLQPISLSRVLATNRHVKGAPPPNVVGPGVACLSPAVMQCSCYNVLDLLKVTCPATSSVTLAHGWPLDVIPDDFIALDDTSLAALRLPTNELTFPSPFRSLRTAAKKGKARIASRSSSHTNPTDANPRNGPRSTYRSRGSPAYSPESKTETTVASKRISGTHVDVTSCKHVGLADFLELSSSLDSDYVDSEQFISMLSTHLMGRALVSGMIVTLSATGQDIHLRVSVVQCTTVEDVSDSPMRITQQCKIAVVPECHSSPLPSPRKAALFSAIGGLDLQIAELKLLAKATLQLPNSKKTMCKAKTVPAEVMNSRSGGVLLYGPPGSGKTMLACALANAYSANLEIIGGQEALSNLASEAVRQLERTFSRAIRKRPSVVLLDDVDALVPRRGAPNIENIQKKLSAALLTLLDAHDPKRSEGVFVIGTTNRPDAIDPAMRRAGRFCQEIEIPTPNAGGRLKILQALIKKARCSDVLEVNDEQMENIATSCHGFVGADLASLWGECVKVSSRRGPHAKVSIDDFSTALKVVRPSSLREIAVEIPSTRWRDVGGKDMAKRRLQEAVKGPLTKKGVRMFSSIGVAPPRGILLYGPPGCSKTLLARAVATESGCNFISVKGAEIFSKWVGESEKAVRSIFVRARNAAPCVIFLDEIDALASSRNSAAGAATQARVVAQLLSEMDGIDTDRSDRRVVTIAATNRPDCLDAAFLRPGRIDLQIYVDLPDAEERLSILKVHTNATPLSCDVDLTVLAQDTFTEGFSGAEVAALVREAALVAMRRDVEKVSHVSMSHFLSALQKVRPRTPASVVRYFESYSKGWRSKTDIL